MTGDRELSSPLDAPLHTGRADEAFTERLRALAEAGLDAENLRKLKKDFDDAATEALDRFEWYVKQEMAGELVRYIAHMAERSVNALLQGNDQEMRRYLCCEELGYNPRDDDTVRNLFGELWDHAALHLRRRIVEAHAELLKNERILDLEKNVADLQALISRQATALAQKDEKIRELWRGADARELPVRILEALRPLDQLTEGEFGLVTKDGTWWGMMVRREGVLLEWNFDGSWFVHPDDVGHWFLPDAALPKCIASAGIVQAQPELDDQEGDDHG